MEIEKFLSLWNLRRFRLAFWLGKKLIILTAIYGFIYWYVESYFLKFCRVYAALLPRQCFLGHFVKTGPRIFLKICQCVIYDVFEPHNKLYDDWNILTLSNTRKYFRNFSKMYIFLSDLVILWKQLLEFFWKFVSTLCMMYLSHITSYTTIEIF